MPIESLNPATGQRIQQYEEMAPGEVDRIIGAAHAAFPAWRAKSFEERGVYLKKTAEILRQRKEEWGKLMVVEMGKTLAAAVAEVDKCAWVCDFYAEKAKEFLAPELVETDASKSFITYQPFGVMLAIMPWNFPFWQVYRFAAPALMAGNCGLLKHASNVPGCALAIEESFREAGLPDNVFRTLLIGSKQVNAVLEHPHLKGVSLTGSTPAGQAVAAKAGSLLKKTVLELGGSDPYLILEDADLDEAIKTCVTSRLICNGQSCIAAKRFIVVEPVREEFTRRFVESMAKVKMGDPLDPAVGLGPLAREDLREDLHAQVVKSIEKGAKLLLGGAIPKQAGAYYPATVLANVTKGMPAYDEELFGPVAAIIGAKDEADAIRIANDTIFGLGAAVFTRDVQRGEEIAATQIEAGCCFVNAFVKSDPRLPFGGIKESGYGRELGYHGIHELVNIKTVYVK
ncbi:MAG: NAD-dependent succinate-semialdehyde dehydrogenase [Candidatus Hydrogenedentes bacterium]|nr:NAD-dependent succinate-semialdehyde dehydrogenase [Candidatus Hydrogenedentota bacterium]